MATDDTAMLKSEKYRQDALRIPELPTESRRELFAPITVPRKPIACSENGIVLVCRRTCLVVRERDPQKVVQRLTPTCLRFKRLPVKVPSLEPMPVSMRPKRSVDQLLGVENILATPDLVSESPRVF